MQTETRSGRKVTVLDVLGNGGMFSRHLPGYEERSNQIETAELIARGVAERTHVVVELGTGGGKSHAGMVGSLQGILNGERVVYSTAVKALQEQIAEKDAPFLSSVLEAELGRKLRYAVLKGRGNYLCLKATEQLEQTGAFRSPAAASAFESVLDWMEEQKQELGVADVESFPGVLPGDLRMDIVTSTEECTGEKCKFYAECFAERAKSRAKEADIIIVNHKLLMMDAVVRNNSEGRAGVLPDFSILIADEAHQMESIARDSFGFEITPFRLTRLGHILQRLTVNHPVIRDLEGSQEEEAAKKWQESQEAILNQIGQYLLDIKLKLEKNEDAREVRLGDERSVRIGAQESLPGMQDTRLTIGEAANQLMAFGVKMEEAAPNWLEGDDRDMWYKAADQTITLASELLTIITPGKDGEWVRRASLDGEEGKTRTKLDAKPIDVAPMMRNYFFSGAIKARIRMNAEDGDQDVSAIPPLVVVAMSATISTDGNMRMWRSRNGCDDAFETVAGSPFDYQRNMLMYLPGSPAELTPVTRNKPGYDEYVDALCAEMAGLTLDAKGGAFLLFTSRSMMNTVHEMISEDLENAGLLVLKQGQDGMSRAQLVEAFKTNGNAVLFGVKTFWEGIDVAGDALRLVAIDKVPFNPPTDVVWSALCDHINRQENDRMASFTLLSIPTAIIALKQGVGRLIRTKSDRGVVALLDGRLRTKPYGKKIIANMPNGTITSRPDDVKAFYNQGERRRFRRLAR